MGCISKREINSNTILPQETRKTSNRQPNFIPKTTEKRRTKPPKISTRKEIIKIRAEIIEKEMKETIVKINKTKSLFFEKIKLTKLSVQFSSDTQSCPTLCNPMNCSTPGLPVHHQLPEFTQTHVHRVGDAIQPSHPLSSPSTPAPNPSQHQGLFQ